MSDTQIIRKVKATPLQQKKLSQVFAKEQEDGTLKPLDISTVSNYLNATRYPNPKAQELRDYAVKILGCRWETTILE